MVSVFQSLTIFLVCSFPFVFSFCSQCYPFDLKCDSRYLHFCLHFEIISDIGFSILVFQYSSQFLCSGHVDLTQIIKTKTNKKKTNNNLQQRNAILCNCRDKFTGPIHGNYLKNIVYKANVNVNNTTIHYKRIMETNKIHT